MVTKCLRETEQRKRERALEKRERATEKKRDSIYREERRESLLASVV
jgi:hypothetical protein